MTGSWKEATLIKSNTVIKEITLDNNHMFIEGVICVTMMNDRTERNHIKKDYSKKRS